MRKIRIGNDIQVSWEVKTNGEAVSLEGRQLRLFVRSAYAKQEITQFSISGCVITFTYPASMQKSTGARALILNDATQGSTEKTICADRAFVIVAHSSEEGDGCDCGCDCDFDDFMVSLRSNVLVARAGMSAYDIWLSQGNTGTEQDFLNSLKGDKGEKGDPGSGGGEGGQEEPLDDADINKLWDEA